MRINTQTGSQQRIQLRDGVQAVRANTVTTKWGRIGTDGQSKTKTFAAESKAKTEYDKLLKEKFSKGYSE